MPSSITVNVDKLIESLERFPLCIEPLVNSLSPGDAKWKPATGEWSVLEILCHLRDEEIEDFRARLRNTLEGTEWSPIDPPGAAESRRYNESSLLDVWNSFSRERQASVKWLQSLQQPNWNSAHHHPQLGKIHAGDLLAAWSAHDWLHLRQISKRLYGLGIESARPWSVDYAGEWTA